MLEFDLVDCWRSEHTNDRKYTWLKKDSFKTGEIIFLFDVGSSFFVSRR